MFKLLDSNRYLLEGTNSRWLHIATIGDNLREYIFIMDSLTSLTYVEEITGGKLEYIADDQLHTELCTFIEEKGLNRFVKAD